MAKIYARKIYEGAINPKTGEAWRLEDVSARWREATEKELEKYEDMAVKMPLCFHTSLL